MILRQQSRKYWPRKTAQVLQEAPTEMGRLNEELSDILNKTTGRKLNIEGAKQNADEAYRSYIAQNADYPVYTAEEIKPTAEQLKAIRPQSKYNPNKKLTREEADALLRDRTALQKLGIYNDELSYMDNAIDKRLGIQHLLGETRNPYIRTLNNTINKPDVKFTWDGREFNAKMYENSDTGKNFMDWIITEDGKLVSKYPTTANHVANQIENGAQNMSLSARVPTGYDGATYAQLPSGTTNNIASNAGNVKQNAPNIKQIISTLNDYKAGKMQEALAKGAAMSDYPVGSLDAVHKAQGVLNDMIESSYDVKNPLKPRATTETTQLMELKQVFNNMLEPSGVKPLDARISKAKSLDYFRDMGYKFKPSEKKFEDLGIKTLRDKRAFLQGRLQAILDNVKDDKNLAKAIRADENTLKKLMPAKKFNELLNETSRIDREYTRLNKFAQLASRELDKPIAADRPMSERSESLTSYLGSLYDKANARLWQNSNRRRAQALLNGGAVNPEWVQTLENYGAQYSPRYLTPYLAQIIAQNQ